MSVSPGQVDRMQERIRVHRDAGMSMYDAMMSAEQDVVQEALEVRALAGGAVRVNRSARTMNDTQMDLMCRGEYARLAVEVRKDKIERQHMGGK
jgi:hypothetical protein